MNWCTSSSVCPFICTLVDGFGLMLFTGIMLLSELICILYSAAVSTGFERVVTVLPQWFRTTTRNSVTLGSRRNQPKNRTTSIVRTEAQNDRGVYSLSAQDLQRDNASFARWRQAQPDRLYSRTIAIQVQHQQCQTQNISGSIYQQ